MFTTNVEKPSRLLSACLLAAGVALAGVAHGTDDAGATSYRAQHKSIDRYRAHAAGAIADAADVAVADSMTQTPRRAPHKAPNRFHHRYSETETAEFARLEPATGEEDRRVRRAPHKPHLRIHPRH